MSIVFKKIIIKNFLSYGNIPTTIILDKPGTTLIVGEDLDNTTSGTGSNGCGKTSLLNALVYGLYDKAISNISKDNLVNNINKKSMEVIVEFDKGNDSYKIERARKMKVGAAGNYVYLYENGKDITPSGVGNVNETIERIIGIPYELFVRIAAFSATHIPFLDLPVRSHYEANQTDIIEELFDLKTLSEKAILLKDLIKDTELSLDIQLTRVEYLQKERDRHEKQLLSAEQRVENWSIQNTKELNVILKNLERIKDVDIYQQKSLHDEYNSLNKQLKESNEKQKSLEQKIKDCEKTIATFMKELEHLRNAKCPYCLQDFKNTVEKIKENESLKLDAETKLLSLEENLTKTDDITKSLITEMKEIKTNINVTNLDELLEIESKLEHYQRRAEELQKSKNPFVEPLEELQAIKLDSVDMSVINTLTETIEHQKFLLKLLTKKDSFVRKTLLNKNIPFLNQRLSYYLTGLGLLHTVEFTHEMTASISQFGHPMDFGNLSNGQRARVNLALSFAFRDVLQSMHDHINICFLDEVLDIGLDSVGVQSAARALKRKAREEKISMFVISHRDEIDSAFDHKMTVQISKGFSYIKYED